MIKHLSVLVQSKTKNTETTERRKTGFRKEVENADLHKFVIKQNNDHTGIMRKIQFRSYFNISYRSCHHQW